MERYFINNIFVQMNINRYFIDELIDYFKKNKRLELILHSLKESVYFYLKYGFLEIDSDKHKFIFDYEGVDRKEENYKIFKILV
jgi:hypothetical protein